jgi:site-specific DNA-methyltransferase (adenine-specific)
MPRELSNGNARLMLGDCHSLLQSLPSGSVDLIYTDPPFGITMARWDDALRWDELWPQFWRVLKPTGAVVIHASQPFTLDLAASQREHFKYMWTWRKNNKTLFARCNTQPLRQVEQILVFYRRQCTYNPQKVRGKKHLIGNPGRSQMYGNAFKRNGSSETDLYHPTDFIEFPLEELCDFIQEKDIRDFPLEEFAQHLRDRKHELNFPTDLLTFHVRAGRSFSRQDVMAEYFIRTYTNPGDTVLDICCSSATTGVACLNTERRFIGMDLAPKHYQLAAERLGLWRRPEEGAE